MYIPRIYFRFLLLLLWTFLVISACLYWAVSDQLSKDAPNLHSYFWSKRIPMGVTLSSSRSAVLIPEEDKGTLKKISVDALLKKLYLENPKEFDFNEIRSIPYEDFVIQCKRKFRKEGDNLPNLGDSSWDR